MRIRNQVSGLFRYQCQLCRNLKLPCGCKATDEIGRWGGVVQVDLQTATLPSIPTFSSLFSILEG